MSSAPPFVILSLPRSRSCWTSTFLQCGHDTLLDVDDLSGVADAIGSGSCETGAAGWEDVLLRLMPDLRLLVVRRPVEQVLTSFATLGEDAEALRSEVERRAKALDALSARPGIITLPFASLSSPLVLNWLWIWARGTPCDMQRAQRMNRQNIQVDWRRARDRLTQRASNVVRLKSAAESLRCSA